LLALAIRHPAATRRQRKFAAADLADIPAAAADAESPQGDVATADLDQALYPLLAERP
jgi:hypothetical protein